MRSVVDGSGGTDAIALPEAETRYLRLALHEGPATRYGARRVRDRRTFAFGASPNAFFQALARDAPRGHYPRGISGEQPSWTIVGVDGGSETALLSEDGALEVARGGFSIEPFIVADSKVVTWADVDVRAFPRRRRPADARRSLAASAMGAARDDVRRGRSRTRRGSSRAMTVRNPTDRPLTLTLVTRGAAVPGQPARAVPECVGRREHDRDDRVGRRCLTVNGSRKVIALTPPDRAGAFPSRGRADRRDCWRRPSGPARKRAGWRRLRIRHALALPIARCRRVRRDSVGDRRSAGRVRRSLCPSAARPDAAAWLARRQERAVAAAWRDKLESRHDSRAAGRLIRSSTRCGLPLAHMLVTRDGPILRPGTRSYARSWIRDGAMMAEALLRTDHANVAADYLRWYAPHQFAQRQGSLLRRRRAAPIRSPRTTAPASSCFWRRACIATPNDRALLASMWPRLAAAARYLEELRQSERTDAEPDTGAARLLRSDAGVDQSRGLLGKADAFVLGRLLGAQGLR